jgi:hypothetical protein
MISQFTHWNKIQESHKVELAKKWRLTLNKKRELISLALDVTRFDGYIWFSRHTLPLSCLHSEQEVSVNWHNGIAIFLINHQPATDQRKVLVNMARIKQAKGRIFSITDSISWGWAHRFTDFRFIVPTISEPIQPVFQTAIIRLFNHFVKIHKDNLLKTPENGYHMV